MFGNSSTEPVAGTFKWNIKVKKLLVSAEKEKCFWLMFPFWFQTINPFTGRFINFKDQQEILFWIFTSGLTSLPWRLHCRTFILKEQTQTSSLTVWTSLELHLFCKHFRFHTCNSGLTKCFLLYKNQNNHRPWRQHLIN